MKKRYLVTGASGLLGSNLTLLSPERWDVVALARTHPIVTPPKNVRAREADLLSTNLPSLLDPFLPLDGIIQTVANTNVNGCQSDPEGAKAVNAQIAMELSDYALANGIHLVHISTDHLFDGVRGDYKETDEPRPINVYAQTKLDAETYIRESNPGASIVRTNFFGYNMQPKNDLAGWMCGELAAGNPIRLFRDVSFSPLLVNDLVSALIEIAERKLAGVLHVTASDHCSKLDFGYELAKAFHFDTNLITAISVDEADFSVPRPKNMSMDSTRAQQLLKTPLLPVRASIERYRQLAKTNYARKIKQMANPSS